MPNQIPQQYQEEQNNSPHFDIEQQNSQEQTLSLEEKKSNQNQTSSKHIFSNDQSPINIQDSFQEIDQNSTNHLEINNEQNFTVNKLINLKELQKSNQNSQSSGIKTLEKFSQQQKLTALGQIGQRNINFDAQNRTGSNQQPPSLDDLNSESQSQFQNEQQHFTFISQNTQNNPNIDVLSQPTFLYSDPDQDQEQSNNNVNAKVNQKQLKGRSQQNNHTQEQSNQNQLNADIIDQKQLLHDQLYFNLIISFHRCAFVFFLNLNVTTINLKRKEAEETFLVTWHHDIKLQPKLKHNTRSTIH